MKRWTFLIILATPYVQECMHLSHEGISIFVLSFCCYSDKLGSFHLASVSPLVKPILTTFRWSLETHKVEHIQNASIQFSCHQWVWWHCKFILFLVTDKSTCLLLWLIFYLDFFSFPLFFLFYSFSLLCDQKWGNLYQLFLFHLWLCCDILIWILLLPFTEVGKVAFTLRQYPENAGEVCYR